MLVLKLALFTSNLLSLIGGIALLSFGVVLINNLEYEHVWTTVPSPLPYSISFYVKLSAFCLSVVIISVSICGCFVVRSFSNWILAVYIFGIVILMMAECIGIILAAVAPQNLVTKADEELMIDMWQRNYGVPGREKYTVSIDHVQTKFECCGVVNGNEYGTSWWSLRELSLPGLRVPLSCCVQTSIGSSRDPQPLNNTACQNPKFEMHNLSRHMEGCRTKLKAWIGEKVDLVRNLGFSFMFAHLLLLLMTICYCVREYSSRK
ncbi:tetraspanin 68C [Rhodnius prolixus]|uniref:tetraspanin 68C n=1 Tax=Rhodnius prolixus TaxID=13249 RepID=UPI003D18F596